ARAGGGPRARMWLAGCRELAPLELGDEQVERAVQHRREIAGGDLVTQQLLGIAQLVVGVLADGELHQEALRRHRCHLGSGGDGCNWLRASGAAQVPSGARASWSATGPGASCAAGGLLLFITTVF